MEKVLVGLSSITAFQEEEERKETGLNRGRNWKGREDERDGALTHNYSI